MSGVGESTATSDWLSAPGRFQPLPSRSLLGDPRGLGVEVQRMFTVSASPGHPGRQTGDLESICREGIATLERETGHPFATGSAPLLLTVRISTRPKVPGRSPAVLNVGLTRDGIEGLAIARGERFARELVLHLMATYAHAVRRVPVATIHAAQCAANDSDDELIDLLDELMTKRGGPLPEDPERQLFEAVRALQVSWNEPATQRDMEILGIDRSGGMVAVQAMAHANADERSGKGIAFTRNLVTGAPGIDGNFAPGYQGGIRLLGDPQPQPLLSMRRRQGTAYASLQSALALLEAAEQDMCAIEFVVESGALRVIEVRTGTSSGPAAIRIAVDLVDSGLLRIGDALQRIPPAALRVAQQPVPVRDHALDPALRGTPASAGTAVGVAVLRAEEIAGCVAAGARPILLQERRRRYDAATIAMCAGVVSADGGVDSQPATLARMLGIPAVARASAVLQRHAEADASAHAYDARLPELADIAQIASGDPVVLDADRGVLYRGVADVVAAQPDTYVSRVLTWCADNQRVPVVEHAPRGYMTMAELKADGTDRSPHTPVLIDVQGSDARTSSARGRQIKAALRSGPRALALRWSDDLERGDGRLQLAPWTMIVAPPERRWAAQLLATRMPIDTATLALIPSEGATD